MTDRPQFWVFAGPNGAGKTTFVTRFRVADRMPVVNPDSILDRIRSDAMNEAKSMLDAGRIAVSERRLLIQTGQSFAIETTLTGRSELRVMVEAKLAGYKVNLVYLGLHDALTSLARVRQRVNRGGHHVPTGVILRRYPKSLANLPAAIGLADRCFILDNSDSRQRLLLTIENGRIRHQTTPLPDWAIEATETSKDLKGLP